MALIAEVGCHLTTNRQAALRSMKYIETVFKRLPVEASADEVIEAVSKALKEKLGVPEPKKKAKKAE